MKAAIIGYGKMGREIEKILKQRGHEVGLIIDVDNAVDLTAENLAKVDVAIEFTTPSTAYGNIRIYKQSSPTANIRNPAVKSNTFTCNFIFPFIQSQQNIIKSGIKVNIKPIVR